VKKTQRDPLETCSEPGNFGRSCTLRRGSSPFFWQKAKTTLDALVLLVAEVSLISHIRFALLAAQVELYRHLHAGCAITPTVELCGANLIDPRVP
jgi:hypothetical protein